MTLFENKYYSVCRRSQARFSLGVTTLARIVRSCRYVVIADCRRFHNFRSMTTRHAT